MRRHLEADVAERLQLLFDGRDDARVLVAGVDHSDARAEIDVALAVLAPDLGVLGALGVDRRSRGRCRAERRPCGGREARRKSPWVSSMAFRLSARYQRFDRHQADKDPSALTMPAETDEFRLEVLVQAFGGAFAAEADLLHATERHRLVREQPFVDADHAGFELLGCAPRAGAVAAEEVGGKAERRVVGEAAMASSSVSKRISDATGPKISSLTMVMPLVTPVSTGRLIEERHPASGLPPSSAFAPLR